MTLILDNVTQFGDPLVFCHYDTDPAGKAPIGRTDALAQPRLATVRRTRDLPTLGGATEREEMQHPPEQEPTRSPIQVTSRRGQDRVSRLHTGR